MLVLKRRRGERICVGDGIVITILTTGKGGVSLGIEAPPEIRVDRQELRHRLDAVSPPAVTCSGTQMPSA